MKSPLFISVVICTYKRDGLLEQGLLSFGTVDNCQAAEVIVVDNDRETAAATQEVVARCQDQLASKIPLRYVSEPRVGLSRARNTGIGQARGEVVAFLDDDARPCAAWLSAIRELFEADPAALVAGGPIEPDFETAPPPWFGPKLAGYFTVLNLGDRKISFPKGACPYGTNMAIRADQLRQHRFRKDLGRIGAQLLSGDEIALIQSIGADPGAVIYLPDMRVRHFVPAERLTEAWVRRRAYFQGITDGLAVAGPLQRAKVVGLALARALYHLAAALPAWRRDRLVAISRAEELRGALKVLFGRSHPAPDSH